MLAYKNYKGGSMIVQRAVSITPSDSTVFIQRPDAIFVGGEGNLAVTWDDGTVTVLVGLLGGNIYPISPKKVMASDTDATSLLALYFDA